MSKPTANTMLLIDDNEDDRYAYRRFMKNMANNHLCIQEAESAEQALEMIKLETPALILLDYKLPDRTGLELLSLLRENTLYSDIPVIMLTGNGNEKVAVEALKGGAKDYLIKSQLNAEKLQSKILSVLNAYHEKPDESSSQQELAKIAYQDPLTGLLNRRAFERSIDQAIAFATRHQNNAALLLIDIDHFKQVNDQYGHQVGDSLLQQVAVVMKSMIRKADIVARIGGDEFAIFLTDIKYQIDAGRVAEKILTALQQPLMCEDIEIQAGVSIGIADFSSADNVSLEEIFQNADIAMYRTKREGRNDYRFYSREMREQYVNRRKIEKGLRAALEREEFNLAYQPIYDLMSKRVCGFETFLCWQSDELGLVEPSVMIPIAEECGLISDIGSWIAKKAITDFQEIIISEHNAYSLALNVSPKQLYNKQLLQVLEHLSVEYAFPLAMLELEITESALMSNTSTSDDMLHQLKMTGLSITLDHFGAGFSSLTHMKNNLPIDIIKIDKSLIKGLTVHDNNKKIVRAMIDIGKNLDYCVSAIGVDLDQHHHFLQNNGCHRVQGDVFDPPVNIEHVRSIITK